MIRAAACALLVLMTAAPAAARRPQAGPPAASPAGRPKTVRDFFNLLPQKYFTLEGCVDDPTEGNCDRARAEYLRDNLEVEDTANGYMKGGCDGAQRCFQMALFKRPDGTYVVGLTTRLEVMERSHFLEYAGGRWRDVGPQVAPGYGADKVYELPQHGTTVGVYENRKVAGKDYRRRGRKLYDLAWRGGRFVIER